MRSWAPVFSLMASLAVACGPTANVEEERNNLLAADREWSQTTKDADKFVSYFAPDASIYAPGMPLVTGTDEIRKAYTEMSSAPGFSLSWTPTKADVGAGGDIGYTTGTYQAVMGGPAEKGKYVTVWKKQPDGAWKVAEDIFNADSAPQAPAPQHVMVAPGAVTWGDPPASLPPGARAAIISGDPTQAQPFALRLQFPAGYRIAPHWHPATENVTVLSGTVSLGMGDSFDQAAMKDLPAGGFGVIPAEMRHYFMAKTASTIQVHGVGPFAINYVNPADDPSKQKP
jgi:ketosteroid isomerase-like protein